MRVGVFAAFLIMSALGTASGAEATAAESPYERKPQLMLSVTTADSGGQSHGGKSVWGDLRAGETIESEIALGEVGGDPCSARPRDPSASAVRWKVKQELVSAWAEGATVNVTIQRLAGPLLGGPFERNRTFQFREGEPLIVDYLVLPGTESKRQCDTMTVRIELVLQDDPSVANAAFEYDVWLVYDDAAGRHTEQFRTVGMQGQRAEFFFDPRKYAADGTWTEVSVSGQVKGRARPDGKFDLYVQPWRAVRTGTSMTGNGGHKEVTVAPRDTVELELPPPPANGPGAVSPSVAKLLASQRIALRITARRIR